MKDNNGENRGEERKEDFGGGFYKEAVEEPSEKVEELSKDPIDDRGVPKDKATEVFAEKLSPDIPDIGEKKPKSRVLRFVMWFLIIVIVLAATAAGFAYNTALSLLEPVDPSDSGEVLVTIPQGYGAGQIAELLEEEGLIQNALVFRLYTRYYYEDALFIAGDYMLNKTMNPDDIIAKLKAGDVFIETLWFVIPEGYHVEQMAEYLAGEGLVSENEFLEIAANPSESLIEDYPFISGQPDNVYYKLEGYLFPAKYEIEEGASVDVIVRLMLRTFQRNLTEENLEKAEVLGMSMHEVVTLASIIEREAASDKELELVSSVFHNRISIGMLLQSCATVQYALGEVKERLLYADLEVDSPYNTYKNNGLPPGPIAAPGEASINAALNPAESHYYYFVSKADGSGEHYFSSTLWEHNANKARAEQN